MPVYVRLSVTCLFAIQANPLVTDCVIGAGIEPAWCTFCVALRLEGFWRSGHFRRAPGLRLRSGYLHAPDIILVLRILPMSSIFIIRSKELLNAGLFHPACD